MKFQDLVKARYSVRKFKNIPIEADKLKIILEAGRVAPTAMNIQPQKIYVAQSESAIQEIRRFTISHYDAPCILIVGYDKGLIAPNSEEYLMNIDATISLTHIMLQATELGIGSVWVRACDFDGLLEALKFPSNFVPVALMPLGYPADDSEPSAENLIRKELSEMVTYL